MNVDAVFVSVDQMHVWMLTGELHIMGQCFTDSAQRRFAQSDPAQYWNAERVKRAQRFYRDQVEVSRFFHTEVQSMRRIARGARQIVAKNRTSNDARPEDRIHTIAAVAKVGGRVL